MGKEKKNVTAINKVIIKTSPRPLANLSKIWVKAPNYKPCNLTSLDSQRLLTSIGIQHRNIGTKFYPLRGESLQRSVRGNSQLCVLIKELISENFVLPPIS